MHPRLVRLAAFGAGLLIAPVAAVVPAHAADPAGTLVVKIVDERGAPVAGAVQVLDATSNLVAPAQLDPPAPSSPTWSFDLPPGYYGLGAMTPYGGLTCAAVTPCGIGTPPVVTQTADLTVAPGQVTTFTVTTPTPQLSGAAVVGATLTATMPASYATVQQSAADYYDGGNAGGPTFADAGPGIVWLRDGVPTGATGATYTLSAADVGRPVVARITNSHYVGVLLASLGITGVPSTDTPAVTVPKPTPTVPTPTVPTPTVPATKVTPKVKVSLPAKVASGKRPTAFVQVRADVPVAGWVRLTVGKWSTRALLTSGAAKIRLAKLKPGRYRVTATYLGSDTVATGKASTALVVKAKRHKK